MLDQRGDIARTVTGTLLAMTVTAALFVCLALLGTGLVLLLEELVAITSA